MRVNIGQAKAEFSNPLARVEAGEEVEIARKGVPIARLVAVDNLRSPGSGSSMAGARTGVRS